MSYFKEIDSYETYANNEDDFHFIYNANSGGGQSFFGGKFRDANGNLASPASLNNRMGHFRFKVVYENEIHDISLADPSVCYEIKPRAVGNNSMKLSVGNKPNPSAVITTFLMLPETCGVKKSENINVSVLSKNNYWLQSMWLFVEITDENNVILTPRDCIIAGGVDESGQGSIKYFAVNYNDRISDIIKLADNDTLDPDIAICIKYFAEIYKGAKNFLYNESVDIIKKLMGILSKKYPDRYSGTLDPITFIKEIALSQGDKMKFNSQFPYALILFGAPGTGKSFTLNEMAKKFDNQENFNVAEAIKLAFEKIDPQKNFVPQCFAIGMKYAKEILENYPKNTQKEINAAIGKEKEDDIAGYYILTGAQAATFSPNAKLSCLNNNFIERVTFHPNYSYSQFVGCYKPIAKIIDVANNLPADKKQILDILIDKSRSGQEKYDLLYDQFKGEDGLTRLPLLIGIYSDDEFHTKKLDGTAAAKDNSVERNHGRAIRPYISLFDKMSKKEEISYEYVPGPFMRTYVAAKKNPGQKFLLIIEEINRANVAAVFGDVFQLLDRKDGVSEYPIATSEDIRKYLKANDIDDCEELRIPNNMYIWATMNSADQGVFPMDTAFKRRWEFEYIGIDENEDGIEKYEIPLETEKDAGGNTIGHKWIKWNKFRHSINDKLTEMKINEDKLLGPYFISEEKLKLVEGKNEEKADEFVKSFKSKVLMYLFEDAVKMRPGDLFDENAVGRLRFSDICKKFDEIGQGIFNFKK